MHQSHIDDCFRVFRRCSHQQLSVFTNRDTKDGLSRPLLFKCCTSGHRKKGVSTSLPYDLESKLGPSDWEGERELGETGV